MDRDTRIPPSGRPYCRRASRSVRGAATGNQSVRVLPEKEQMLRRATRREYRVLYRWCLLLAWTFSVDYSIATCMAGLGDGKASNLAETSRPNIVWITSEDNGPQLACYGDRLAVTPNLDQLAARSIRFTRCWSNAPVCAPARTTLITGVWPTSLGASHMRSEVPLPAMMQLFPQYLRQAGYYCTNRQKEDYNVRPSGSPWDASGPKAHWKQRSPDQPFFSVFNIGTTHESQIRKRPHDAKLDPQRVSVPPYHPDLPEVRRDWAQYYDKIEQMDQEVGEILRQLEEENLLASTIVFYFGDHGSGMPRSKRWLYQGGLHVPLLISLPPSFSTMAAEGMRTGTASDIAISFIDMAPTTLSLAGIKPPEWMSGRALLGKYQSEPGRYQFGFRDRMDERVDCSRAVRDERYLYIRNWMPHQPQGQFLDYMFLTPTTQVWEKHWKEGKTNHAQSAFWLPKPTHELYDLSVDPHQIHNLIGQKEIEADQIRLSQTLLEWMVVSRDWGLTPESIMLADSRGSSPWEIGRHLPEAIMRSRIKAADWASEHQGAQQDPMSEASRWLQSEDPVERYWGAMGLLIRKCREEIEGDLVLEPQLQDREPMVRVVAAEFMARSKAPGIRVQGVDHLVAIALTAKEDSDASTIMLASSACHSLLNAQISGDRVAVQLSDLPSQPTGAPARYHPYLKDYKRLFQEAGKQQ